MDSLSGFAVFVQVAETGSFAAAGRMLNVSASAVGKRVARLEARLGVRLFHRSTRSIALTAEGKLLLARSRRVLDEVEAAEQELMQAGQRPSGRLRVSLPPIGALVLSVLGDFSNAYPEVELDLDFTSRVVDLVGEGFDVVMRSGVLSDSGLGMRRIGAFSMHMVASPAYLALRGEPRQPADLITHRCLHYRAPHSGKIEPWPLRPDASGTKDRLPVSIATNDNETRLQLALQGAGIVCLPEFSVREHLAAGRLCELLADAMNPAPIDVYLLWPPSPFPSPKLRVFIDFLAANMFTPRP